MTNAIEIKDLAYKFKNSKCFALNNICANIKKGVITGIVGPDSAGKTTLLRNITGLLVPSSGTVRTLSLNPKTQKDKINKLTGYMPQKFGLYEDLSVRENLELYSKLKEIPQKDIREMFEKLYKFTNLEAFKERLAGKLSGGMKQKLALACALLGKPDLLILDEPSVGVDPISRKDLMSMVRALSSEHTTTIWSTSYMDEAHSFDVCIVMNKGKIIYCGKPQDLGNDTKNFENKVIELMGGYKKKDSALAKDFELKKYDILYPIEADSLEKKYGDFYAVKNNTFCIKKGEIFGLLGPNGAGKSTSFKMMCGLIKPSYGSAKIMGEDIVKNPSKARSYIGYMAQKFSLYSRLSVMDNLDFFSGAYGLNRKERKKRISMILEIFNLEKYKNTVTEFLPLGYKQRLSLGCAIIHEPPVLFLDEPTSGVDAISRREFWTHIRALSKIGVSVLVTTHFMDEARFCDNISLFYNGEIIALDKPSNIIVNSNAKDMQDAFIKIIKEAKK